MFVSALHSIAAVPEDSWPWRRSLDYEGYHVEWIDHCEFMTNISSRQFDSFWCKTCMTDAALSLTS